MARRKRKRPGTDQTGAEGPTEISLAERQEGGVGARLRRAREARGLSLRQIADATKISHSFLEAIERDDLKRLPGGIFTRAFVRSYAQAVGLQPDRTLDEFLAQAPETAIETGALPPPEPPPAAESSEGVPVWRIALALLLPISLVVAYVALRPAARQTGPMFDRRPLLADRVPALGVETLAPAIGAVRASATPATAVQGLPADGRIRVVLSPRAECWLSARLDGEPGVSRLLAAGEEITLEADQEIVLKLGDAGAVSITVNGEPMRVLGRPGEVVTARIAQDTLSEYLATP